MHVQKKHTYCWFGILIYIFLMKMGCYLIRPLRFWFLDSCRRLTYRLMTLQDELVCQYVMILIPYQDEFPNQWKFSDVTMYETLLTCFSKTIRYMYAWKRTWRESNFDQIGLQMQKNIIIASLTCKFKMSFKYTYMHRNV